MELSVVRPVFQSKADLTLTIAGSWSIVRKPAAPAAAHAKMAGKDTSLTLTPDYYMSAILTLKAKSSP